ncbi:Spy/CpxP family protein refolding chaperone [Desulforamulus aquiferis]|uniref:Spy/CpxP family protein refolding chaperone n=1 Tax=Desulforamulus aquiferis TaxID=1397668 RepID=A0AAW7ZEE3_9FIRM|nr:Spy/CpxP family protein refolding chaperone [Desulforamulus aquiferis]MDO7787629.1 Spy/CpxP family protein refolding chaperone [Desulforamulus aquiferis]RYD02987.1 hypothetical protein N752_21480 [Desulforamulus aquiferis]
MKKAVTIMLTLLLAFSIVQVASAEKGWGHGSKQHYSTLGEDPINNLKLTDEQINKLRDIQKKNHQETRELRIKLQDNIFELKQLKFQRNPDKSKVDTKVNEIKELKNKLSEIRQRNKTECQSVLTDEQKAKLPKNAGPTGPNCGKGPCTTE